MFALGTPEAGHIVAPALPVAHPVLPNVTAARIGVIRYNYLFLNWLWHKFYHWKRFWLWLGHLFLCRVEAHAFCCPSVIFVPGALRIGDIVVAVIIVAFLAIPVFDLVFTNAGMDTHGVRWACFRSSKEITFFVLTILPVAV